MTQESHNALLNYINDLIYIGLASKIHDSNSNWTFIALNLPKQEDFKAQQNKKQSTFCVQGHNRGAG